MQKPSLPKARNNAFLNPEGHGHFFDSFALLRKELPKQARCQWELFANFSEGSEFKVKNQESIGYEKYFDGGFCLRLFSKGRMGFSYCTDFEPQAVLSAIDRAKDSMAYYPVDQARKLPELSQEPYVQLHHWDTHHGKYTDEDKLILARELERSALETDRRITQIDQAHYSEVRDHVFLTNSLGLDLEHHETDFTLSLMVISEDKKKRETQSSADFAFSPFLKDLDPVTLGRQTARLALEALGARKIKSGSYELILENRATAELLEVLEPALSALSYFKKTSFLQGKLKQQIFADEIDLIDDPTLFKRIGSTPFDGEGSPTHETVLVQGGALVNLLSDAYTARKLKLHNTARASRSSLRSPPGISSTNLFIAPGNNTLNEMIDSTAKGILVREFLGLHTANLNTGKFSFGASGFLIHKGRISHPIRDFTVSGNLGNFFQKVRAVGADLEFSASYGAPALACGKHLIGGQ